MTLTVSAYRRTQSGIQYIETNSNLRNDLAGVESSRYSFYFDICYKQLGIQFFSVMQERDLYVEQDDLCEFKQAIQYLKTNLNELFDDKTEYEYWSFRVENIMHAIEIAMNTENGGVNLG